MAFVSPQSSPPPAATAGERVEYFRPASLPGAELLAVHDSSGAWHVFHERYALCICHRAAARVRYRGREDPLTDGSVAVWEPGETHCTTCVAKPADFRVLDVEPSLLAEAAHALGRDATPHFAAAPRARDPNLFRLLNDLCCSIETGAPPLEQQERFTTTVAAVLRRTGDTAAASADSGCSASIARAKDYLREHYSEPVTLAELADASGMSRFHLVHAFTRQVGLAPHAYLIHVRVGRAGGLLRRGVPATEVAACMGFADQSHFARHFKQVMHVTPGAYARCGAAARTF